MLESKFGLVGICVRVESEGQYLTKSFFKWLLCSIDCTRFKVIKYLYYEKENYFGILLFSLDFQILGNQNKPDDIHRSNSYNKFDFPQSLWPPHGYLLSPFLTFSHVTSHIWSHYDHNVYHWWLSGRVWRLTLAPVSVFMTLDIPRH